MHGATGHGHQPPPSLHSRTLSVQPGRIYVKAPSDVHVIRTKTPVIKALPRVAQLLAGSVRLPMGHFVQAAVPPAPNMPAAHVAQALATSCVPGEQVRHEADPALLSSPGPQSVHAVPALFDILPTAHSPQLVVVAAPAFGENLPGWQGTHSSLLSAPSAKEYFPAPQGVQHDGVPLEGLLPTSPSCEL
jgi:hypothetical protein